MKRANHAALALIALALFSLPGLALAQTNAAPTPTTPNPCWRIDASHCRLQPAGGAAYHLSGGTSAATNATAAVPATVAPVILSGGLIVNTSGTIGYLKLYDSATSPTCSSATGLKYVIPIPASTAGAGLSLQGLGLVKFSAGVAFCVTGGGGDTDNTNGPAGIYVSLTTQ